MVPIFKFTQTIDSPVPVTYYGQFPIERERLAVILNSRQGKMPCGNDRWVKKTVQAAKYIADNNLTALTSIGLNTWELATWACSDCGARQVIICSIDSIENAEKTLLEISADFGLDQEKTGWLFYKATPKARSVKTDWPLRDRLALGLAIVLIPISLRPGGNLENLIGNWQGKTIISDFKTDYAGQVTEHIKPLDAGNISPEVANLSWDHVCHWTHACYGRWPKQSSADFYRRLVESEIYPNSALSTMQNIFVERLIRASSQKIRNGNQVVAFSSLHPQEFLPLMSWRKRYVRYNFEPYGVAISRNAAVNIGIRPVIYGPPSLYKRLSESDKPFFQNEGVHGGNWRPENEWRHLGDVDLSKVEPPDLKIIVREKTEIELIRDIAGCNVVSFG